MRYFKRTFIALAAAALVSLSTLTACDSKSPVVEQGTTEVVTEVVTIPTKVISTTAPTAVKTVESVTEIVKEEEKGVEESDDDGSNSNPDNSSSNVDMASSSDDVDIEVSDSSGGAIYSPSEFQSAGVISWGGYNWTYYSELVLPGYGLNIPGRHTTEDGYVCDGDGYVVLAADLSMLPRYSIVDTPFGRVGKVYDTGCAYGVLDVYVGW